MTSPHTMVQNHLADATTGFLDTQGAILGIDLGSYGLRAAVIDLQARTYHSANTDSYDTSPDGMIRDAVALANGLLQSSGIRHNHLVRVGVGFAGPVDTERGVVRLSPRMSGWENIALCDQIEDAFGAATLLDNDANLIALGEATFGVGRDVQHLLYCHLSSGVGGGLVLNRRLYHGATNTAGEIGHAVVGPIDPLQPNARPGTLEQHIAVQPLLQRAANLGVHTTNLEDVFAESAVGHQMLGEVADLLAVRLSQIVALLDPHMIVLGGIVARVGGEPLINAVREHMQVYTSPVVKHIPPIVPSGLGFESVVIGALARALESLHS